MAKSGAKTLKGDVWFAYDGDCPVCTSAAHALQIRKNVGALHLVNARENEDHPLIREITRKGLDLDEGMVLKFQGVCYHGRDALHMMAMLGSGHGWFNKATALPFRSKTLARLCYPPMRTGRNLLLYFKGVEKIRNLESLEKPIFARVFGTDWNKLPKVMRDHYAVRPFSGDRVVVKGHLDVEVAAFMRAMSRLTGMLVSRSGKSVPVTVTFTSGRGREAFHFDRVFHFTSGDEKFRSRMEHIGGNELVEFMGAGIGWKTAYGWDGEKVTLSHRGYVWRIFGILIPIPLALIIGKGEAEEIPVSDDTFRMWTHAEHPWFGKCFAYGGSFSIVEVSCRAAS